MNSGKKTNIALLISGIVILLLFFFVINPVAGQIKRKSESIAEQKKEFLEFEAKIKNIHDFQNNFKQYRRNLEKINQLFVNISEPIEFIEFLENEAANFQLSIEISSPAVKEQDSDLGSALEFSLNSRGPFPNFLKFLERLESAPYLIKPMRLSINKIQDQGGAISAALLLKTYAR